jgi:hypothetical protein
MGGDVTPKPGLTKVISFLNWRSFEKGGPGLIDIHKMILLVIGQLIFIK